MFRVSCVLICVNSWLHYQYSNYTLNSWHHEIVIQNPLFIIYFTMGYRDNTMLGLVHFDSVHDSCLTLLVIISCSLKPHSLCRRLLKWILMICSDFHFSGVNGLTCAVISERQLHLSGTIYLWISAVPRPQTLANYLMSSVLWSPFW